MMDSYDAEDRGIRILEMEDSFQMCTKMVYFLDKFLMLLFQINMKLLHSL